MVHEFGSEILRDEPFTSRNKLGLVVNQFLPSADLACMEGVDRFGKWTGSPHPE